MQLTQKETSLLKDLKTQEKLCAEKYEKYSAEALDPQLKTLFSGIADTERHHFSMLEQIEGGSAPATAGGSKAQPGFPPPIPLPIPTQKSTTAIFAPMFSQWKSMLRTFTTPVFLNSRRKACEMF